MSSVSSESENVIDSSNKDVSALQDNIDKKGKNSYYFAHSHKANGPKWDGKPQPRLLSKTSTNSDGVVIESESMNAADVSQLGQTTAETLQISSSVGGGSDGDRSQLMKRTKSSFDYSKSNITKYAFLDEGTKVKLYIDMVGIGEACNVENGDITLDWDETSFNLVVKNYQFPSSSPEENNDDGDDDDDDEKGEKEGDGVKECPVHRLCFGRLHGPISKAIFRKKKDKIILTLQKKLDDEEGDEEPKAWPAVGAMGADNDD